MQTINFIKACSIGNDFVIIKDHPFNTKEKLSSESQHFSDRHWGIGCDQVIYFKQNHDSYDVRFFNADGSEAEMCGNGARCLAKLITDEISANSVKFKTKGGMLICEKRDDQILIYHNKPKVIQALEDKSEKRFEQIYFINVGNPHLVCFLKNKKDFDFIDLFAPKLETEFYSKEFGIPKRVNVGFVFVEDKETIELRVWERGCGFTKGCGSGACAAAVAALASQKITNQILVQQPGGLTGVHLHEDGIMTIGQAFITYRGTIELAQ